VILAEDVPPLLIALEIAPGSPPDPLGHRHGLRLKVRELRMPEKVLQDSIAQCSNFRLKL
jgi:hypothetical protein